MVTLPEGAEQIGENIRILVLNDANLCNICLRKTPIFPPKIGKKPTKQYVGIT
jgi:hypothetical protein